MRRSGERGATLVHVAFILAGVILFSGFVIDYGAFWIARRQAQNSADAGALAGALARIHEDQALSPSTTTGVVHDIIVNTVAQNAIWGVAPAAANVDIGWECPDLTTNCVRVDVFRDGTHSSSQLPTFFLRMANVQNQKVRAHAVARLIPAAGTGCMRPWFLIDKYVDANNNGHYDAGDSYTPYDPATQTGTGYRLTGNIGDIVYFHDNLSPSGYGQVDVGSGGSDVQDAIEQCASGDYFIGDTVPIKPGGTVGPETHGVDNLISWDSGASLNSDGTLDGSCQDTTAGCSCPSWTSCPNGPRVSPRIVIVPVCSPLQASCAAGGQNNDTITITDFLSFWIVSHEENGNDMTITAQYMGAGGLLGTGGGPTSPGGFLGTVVLIR
jgi:hypothetical protein